MAKRIISSSRNLSKRFKGWLCIFDENDHRENTNDCFFSAEKFANESVKVKGQL